jgi:hypothetical protein
MLGLGNLFRYGVMDSLRPWLQSHANNSSGEIRLLSKHTPDALFLLGEKKHVCLTFFQLFLPFTITDRLRYSFLFCFFKDLALHVIVRLYCCTLLPCCVNEAALSSAGLTKTY